MRAPTPFADLNDLLAEFTKSVWEILGENFCGAYLQGSFAVGDADVHSDVDFIVATNRDVDGAEQAALQALHERLFSLDTLWAQHLEGSYVPIDRLRELDPSRAPWFYFDNGATTPEWDNHDNTAVVRWSLREHGIVLAGPRPDEIVDPVVADALRNGVRVTMQEWASWLRTRKMSRRQQTVVVLSFCRMLHTLAIGEVTSKRTAGEWALATLEPEWRNLIQRALDERPDPWTKVREPADADAIARTLAFVDYALRTA